MLSELSFSDRWSSRERNPRHFSHPIRCKTKTNRDSLAQVFPRFASAASSFDWFSVLSLFFVIGQSDYFSFVFVLQLIENRFGNKLV